MGHTTCSLSSVCVGAFRSVMKVISNVPLVGISRVIKETNRDFHATFAMNNSIEAQDTEACSAYDSRNVLSMEKSWRKREKNLISANEVLRQRLSDIEQLVEFECVRPHVFEVLTNLPVPISVNYLSPRRHWSDEWPKFTVSRRLIFLQLNPFTRQ